MKIVIGIVTHQRPQSLLRLLRQLSEQINSSDVVMVVENGSGLLDKKSIGSTSSNVFIFHQKKASIPLARNFIFHKAKHTGEVLIFLDDDVLLPKNWFEMMKQALQVAHKSHFAVVQGNFHSYPKQNIYAQTTEILTQLWLQANLLPNSRTQIIDTKHVGFLLNELPKIDNLFDNSLKFATDIATAAVLINQSKIKILFVPNLFVFHRERTSWWSFVQHRFRLSRSFRIVAEMYPGFFKSVSARERFSLLWQKLPQNIFSKCWIVLNLLIIYGAVLVSNLITSARRR